MRMRQSVPFISVSLARYVVSVVISIVMPILFRDHRQMFKVHVSITTKVTEFDTVVDLRIDAIFVVMAMLVLRLWCFLLLILLVTVLVLILFILLIFLLVVVARFFVCLFAIFLVFLVVLTIFLCRFVRGLDRVGLVSLLGDQIEVPFNLIHILAMRVFGFTEEFSLLVIRGEVRNGVDIAIEVVIEAITVWIQAQQFFTVVDIVEL